MDPRFAASAICRFRDLPLPRFAASAICRIRDLPHPPFARLLARYGFLVASGAFWAASGAKRRRGMRCGLVRRSVRAPPYAPADGARAVGLLGWFWRVLGFWWLLARSGRSRQVRA
jgi:hypothetical protein